MNNHTTQKSWGTFDIMSPIDFFGGTCPPLSLPLRSPPIDAHEAVIGWGGEKLGEGIEDGHKTSFFRHFQLNHINNDTLSRVVLVEGLCLKISGNKNKKLIRTNTIRSTHVFIMSILAP